MFFGALDLNQVENSVFFSTHCLDRNISKAYELFGETLQKTNFSDLSRLKTTILANASSMKNSIVESGHSYATMYAASSLIPSQAVNEKLVGISQIAFMDNLSRSDDMAAIVDKLMVKINLFQ